MSFLMIPGTATARLLHAQTRPAQWQLVQDLRVGSIDRRDYTFVEGRYLLAGREGRIYVAEPPPREVLVYDSRGTFVKRIGGRGRGPGEFESIAGLGWRGDTLWIVDRLQSRVSFYTEDGRLISATAFLPPSTEKATRPIRLAAILSDGAILAVADLPPYSPTIGGGPMMQQPLLRYGSALARPDTLSVVTALPSSVRFATPTGARSATLRASARNHDRWKLAPDGSFLVVVRPEAKGGVINGYTVEAIRPSGVRIFRRSFEHAPIPVTKEVRERTVGEFANGLIQRNGFTRAAAIRLAGQLLPLPAYRFAVAHLLVGMDGRIWLSRHDMIGTFVVLDGKTGAEIAHATMPDGAFTGVGANAVDADFMWIVERDSLGVPYVVRYRIVRG